jgi:hypothetical protein
MDAFTYLLENITVVIWAIAIIVFSVLTVLVPFFIWRISANVAAIREVIEAYLYEVMRKEKKGKV